MYQAVLGTWANIVLFKSIDRVFAILNVLEENTQDMHPKLYLFVFNLLGNVALLVKFDPNNQDMPAHRAVGLLHKLVKNGQNNNSRVILYLNDRSYDAIINAQEDYGEFSPENLVLQLL